MDGFLRQVKERAEQAGVFGEITLAEGMLCCAALASAEPASYRLERQEETWHVSLVTPDRWLSQSIEADLLNTGDPIEELVEDELIDLGHEGPRLPVKHFRSDDMLYTFRSPIPIDPADEAAAVEAAARCLLAYEAAFRELGNMQTAEEGR